MDGISLGDRRMKICEDCPLYKETEVGPICDNERWINENKRVSKFPKIGYIRGCGCKLRFKTNNPASHCPLRFW